MKSVQEFFGEEKRRPNSSPTKDAIEDARKKLAQQFNRPSRVSANPSGYTITNLPGGNVPDEQKFSQLEKLAKRRQFEKLAKQKQSKSVRAAADVADVNIDAVKIRNQAAKTAQIAGKTQPPGRRRLGDTTRGGPVRITNLKVSRPAPAPKPEKVKPVKQAKVSKAAKGYRELERTRSLKSAGDWTRARMSRAYGKNLATTGDSIIDALRKEGEKQRLSKKTNLKLQTKSTKTSTLGFPATSDITKGTKGGQLSTGIKGGKFVDTTIKQVKVSDVTKPPSTTRPAQLPAGTTKTTKTTTQPGRAPSTYRGTGAGRVEVSAPTKKQTQLLTPGQKTPSKAPEVKVSRTYTPPKVDRGPSISVTEPKKVSYKQFTKQAGTTKIRKDAWSYSPSAAKSKAQSQAVQNVKQTLKQTNPTKYARQVQRRGMNIAKIRAGKGGGSGFFGGVLAGADAMNTYKAARQSGETKQDATKKAIAVGGGGWVGAELGAKMGAKIGSKLPGRLGLIGAGIGGIAGGLVGGTVGTEGGKALYRSQKDKDFANFATRRNQRGVSSDKAQFKSDNKAVIRDASGKERVGYKAYKDGKEVYKTGDTRSLAITSSNPLERIGRTVAGSNLGPVSDWLKSRYSASDEAARKKKVASLKP